MSIELNLQQVKQLLQMFDEDDDSTVTIFQSEGELHSGPGLYVHNEYPEDGYIFLGPDPVK